MAVFSYLVIGNQRVRMTSEERIRQLESENAALKDKVSDLDRKIAAKDNRIAYLEKQLYGQRTEKHLPVNPDALQLSLFHNAIDPDEQRRLDAEAAKDEAARERLIHIKEHDRQVRKVMDTSRLPVREEHLYPEMENPEDYREIGEPEVTESLVLIPQQMYIRRIIRHKMVLKSSVELADTERKVFAIAPLPPAPLHKCMASESLLADIILQKFLYHMPFYRVIQRYREMGVTISDSTMGDWYAAVCEKLKILYDRLKAEVLSCDYVQVDESTIPVIDNEKRKTRKGYMWCVRDVLGGSVFFHYDLGSRSTRTAMTLLKDFKGAIQSDGYEVYEKFDGLEDKTMLGCWAHARRKFVEAMGENGRLASEALVYIGDLYHVETLAKEAGMSPEGRMTLRKEKAYPQIRKFEEWIEAKYPYTTDGSLLRKAMEYTYKRLPKLAMYVNDGNWLIDNNLVENAIRPLALGRKNYLFCGNDASAVRASMMYSFIATCKANDIDPRSWFEDVIRRIPEYEYGEMDVSTLLPQHWSPTSTTPNKVG